MEINKKIDSSILEIYPLMPSSGEWPFTMMKIERSELKGAISDLAVVSPIQLLVLSRTDFGQEQLIDYAKNSKEYLMVPHHNRTVFLERFVNKFKDSALLTEWADNITSMAVGLALRSLEQKGLLLKQIEIELDSIDQHLSLRSKDLLAFSLFDVLSSDEK